MSDKINVEGTANIQSSPVELVKEFNEIMGQTKKNADNSVLYKKANQIAEMIIQSTLQNYENTCGLFMDIRGGVIENGKYVKPIDDICWTEMNKYLEKYVSVNKRDISILDAGTGSGRDMIYGQSLGYHFIGIDKCDGFIKLLSKHVANGSIKENSFKICDIRALDFPDGSFDLVRHNASLLHLPLIGKNYTVDLALSEAHRVLKPHGLLYAFVKTGSALEIHDTGEKLGGRIFQFFSHKTLNEVVTRNDFTILYTSDVVELRGETIIDWILLIAKKNN